MFRTRARNAVLLSILRASAFEADTVPGVTAFSNGDRRPRPSRARPAAAALPAVDTFELPDPTTAALDAARGGPLGGSRGEVVGSTGRVGSLLLRAGGGLLAAAPRGLAPGSLSPPGTPILVAVPASAVADVVRTTAPGRQGDIVLVANGLPSRLLGDFDGLGITAAVPHFGVLRVGGDAITSPRAPSTVVHGRHGATLRRLLEPWGVRVAEANTMSEVEACALRKLLWTSLMWLLCHEDGDGDAPVDVATVHATKARQLRDLVEEALPAARSLAGGAEVGSVDAVLEYLERYSLSMPQAIPNKQLAIEELAGRNGVLLGVRNVDQPRHRELLAKVAGESCVENCGGAPLVAAERKEEVRSLPHAAIPDIAFTCHPAGSLVPSRPPVETAVVVGAGVVGSAVALGLARRGIRVTVLDGRDVEGGDPGATTAASWAWLNANDKHPHGYFALNYLGMVVWRRDPALRALPVWCGSLVRRREDAVDSEDAGRGGAYCRLGPLCADDVARLEPAAAFLDGDREAATDNRARRPSASSVAYYPDEGHVDPVEAVRALRAEARRLGATFVGNATVVDVACAGEGRNGRVSLEGGAVVTADVVIAAAGTGAAAAMFGGIPMLERPGAVAFAEQTGGRRDPRRASPALRRILVDAVSEAHVLQRRGGPLVAGGGRLQVGGPAAAAAGAEEVRAGARLLAAAALVAPSALDGAVLLSREEAGRPMPRDGLPVAGFVGPGLYAVASHSGVTLGPLLGELVAGEISRGVRYDLLESFRPARFAETGR